MRRRYRDRRKIWKIETYISAAFWAVDETRATENYDEKIADESYSSIHDVVVADEAARLGGGWLFTQRSTKQTKCRTTNSLRRQFEKKKKQNVKKKELQMKLDISRKLQKHKPKKKRKLKNKSKTEIEAKLFERVQVTHPSTKLY